jgi:tRNA-Thr(GGU) m(6)t(6)A37 methyltransferase TsaA
VGNRPALPGLRSIGVISSPFLDPDETPVQAALASEAEGVAELDPELSDALDGLSGFDYAWILTWLGGSANQSAEEINLRPVPFLLSSQPRQIGYLATRGPRRINPIGLSLVRILEVHPPKVRFAGVDMVDGTLVLDIKPYVSRFDGVDRPVRCGWFDGVEIHEGSTPNSLKRRGVETA